MTTEKTLTEQRAALELDVYNTYTDAFPGSRAWLKHDAASRALRAFDAAHAAEAARVEAERLAAQQAESKEAMAREYEIPVEEYVARTTKPAAATTTPTLYFTRSLPLHWVASDETGALWIFEGIEGGWQGRQPYAGSRQGLTEAGPYNALGTGWPHA